MARPLRSLAEVVERIYANTRPEGGCLVTTRRRDKGGYAEARWSKRPSWRAAHKFVAEWFLGPCPERQQVRHMCGRGKQGCVTGSHLRYGSPGENGRDAARHGSHRGERNGRAKLTDEQVREVRRLLREGVSGLEIERKLGISDSMVSFIKQGVHWAHVKGE